MKAVYVVPEKFVIDFKLFQRHKFIILLCK